MCGLPWLLAVGQSHDGCLPVEAEVGLGDQRWPIMSAAIPRCFFASSIF